MSKNVSMRMFIVLSKCHSQTCQPLAYCAQKQTTQCDAIRLERVVSKFCRQGIQAFLYSCSVPNYDRKHLELSSHLCLFLFCFETSSFAFFFFFQSVTGWQGMWLAGIMWLELQQESRVLISSWLQAWPLLYGHDPGFVKPLSCVVTHSKWS